MCCGGINRNHQIELCDSGSSVGEVLKPPADYAHLTTAFKPLQQWQICVPHFVL